MAQIKKSTYTHRYFAKITLEAATPLAVGSGEKDIITDSLVITDTNGLPYIPGTSLAGVLRHSLKKDEAEKFFGCQTPATRKGSEVIFSEARLVGKEGTVIDGLKNIDFNDDFYKYFKILPIRQHVKITPGGVAANTGKFDGQIVFKGSRFCFEIEMVTDGSNWNVFDQILTEINKDSFRLGGGTRKGLGEMKIVSCQIAQLDLRESEDLEAYLNKSSDLSANWNKYTEFKVKHQDARTTYTLQLEATDFFLFGSGLGNTEADITPVQEMFISWENNKPSFNKNNILIPATSVKGALAHRTAYHYNLLKGYFAGDELATSGSKNEAVRMLFGDDNPDQLKRGNVILSDIIERPSHGQLTTATLDHVSIDRFTGGAIDGALFKEQVIYDEQVFTLKISLDCEPEKEILVAFENALQDLCDGMLPLGGGTNRGNGCFKGEIIKTTRA